MHHLSPIEIELHNLKSHKSYLLFRISHAVSTGELRMLEAALKRDEREIACIEAELGLNANA
ncbi:MAG: hypothetical protein EBR30_17160 [Cytophagia bacterium]|nr:hypothetical protein [Cytophagia bacterium]NBW36713.1 hypothetical protein [Cytophagia bacterium]